MYLGSIVVEMNTKMVASGVISRDYLFIILCKIQMNPMLSLASRLREEKKKIKKTLFLVWLFQTTEFKR